jgi:hypothetical protein
MAIRKNKKRIDPRYFLHETTYRDEIDEGEISNLYKKPSDAAGGYSIARGDIEDHSDHESNMHKFQSATGKHPDEDPDGFVSWASENGIKLPGGNGSYQDRLQRHRQHQSTQQAQAADAPQSKAFGQQQRSRMRSRLEEIEKVIEEDA